MQSGKTEQVHKLYEECQKIFEPTANLLDEVSDINDETEKEFYIRLSDFFLQQKQKEVIKKGLF